MGCFTSCFGNFRKRNSEKNKKILSRDQRCGIQRSLQPVEQSLIPEKLEKYEDELNLINKKNVTFDTNIKTHKPISIPDSTHFLDVIEIAIKNDEPDNNLLDPTTSPLLPKDRSFPPNHRYMNYTEDSEEEEEADAIGYVQETDLNDGSEDGSESTLEQVWSEAIPFASMDSRTDEVEDNSLKLNGSPVHIVLNDASLSNWLVTTPRSYNMGIEMNSSENKDGSSKSPMWRRIEDRPILGALTVEELNKYLGSSLRSPSQSPRDDMPILESSGNNINKKKTSSGSGFVSSIKGIPNTCSKYREDKKVNWHSTPFEKRLDRALHINSPLQI